MCSEPERAMRRIVGSAAAPGLARGPLVRLTAQRRFVRSAGTPAEECHALAEAMAAAKTELNRLAAASEGEAAAIIGFQVALLEDDALAAPAMALIARGQAADRAWRTALDAQIADYAAASDPYFRGRSADLKDLRDRVLDLIAGAENLTIPPGAIVSAEDLAPSRFLSSDWQGGGIALDRGSPTSHLAILARAR